MELIYTLPCRRDILALYVYKLNKFRVTHTANKKHVFQMIDEYFWETATLKKLRYLFYSLKAFIPKSFMLQQHNRNSGVKLPNCYSHAKFEKFLPAIYRDIHHLINVIYYS